MPRRSVDLAAALAVGAFMIASGAALVSALSAEPWVRYALRIETTDEPSEMSESTRLRLLSRLSEAGSSACAWDVAASQVTIALELLRRAVADGSARAQTEQIAMEAVSRAIRCNAADGNLWYLLALLEHRSGARWDRVQDLLLLSAALSPNEGDLLAKRARLVALQLARQDTTLAIDVQADLRRAVAVARTEVAAAVLRSLRESGHAVLADGLISGLPEARLEALTTGTDWRRSTFGRPERYRSFDYEPSGARDRP